jgi:hypothetical protein
MYDQSQKFGCSGELSVGSRGKALSDYNSYTNPVNQKPKNVESGKAICKAGDNDYLLDSNCEWPKTQAGDLLGKL